MLIFLINSKRAESLKNLLAGNGLRISNNKEPTRVSNGRGTLIDAIFSNFLIETKVTSTCITDHHTVEGSFDLDGSPEKYPKALKSRSWHNLDNPIIREKFEKDLRYLFEVHKSSLELLPIDNAFKKFHEMLTEALNSHLPEKHRKRKITKIGLKMRLKTQRRKNWQMQLEVHKLTKIFQKIVKTLNHSSNLKNKLFIKTYLKPIR